MIGLNSLAQRQVVKNLTTFDDKRLHFGFTLALNAFDFNVDHYPLVTDNSKYLPPTPEQIDGKLIDLTKPVRADISKLTPGFTVGIITNLRLTEALDLRFLPGMSFGERKLVYNIHINDKTMEDAQKNPYGLSEYFSIKSTFLDFPLLIKYKARRMNNQRPYLIGGVAYRIDISKSGKDDLVRLKQFSSYLEAGMGWDSYLQFFRLSTEFKFSFGLDNMLDVGPESTQLMVYSSAISRLTSNIFILSFHFE